MKSEGKPLVDFVAVGAGKCGTTWLYGLMKAHGEICESRVKETLFFETYHHKGYGWYESLFQRRSGHRTAGEVSNTYIFDPRVARRIYEYNPGMKIIVTVRNPVERALSHFLWLLRNGVPAGSFGEAIANREYGLLERGRYFEKLAPYLELFPAAQVKVLIFEDLRRDANAYGEAFLRFVGVDPRVPAFDTAKFQLEASAPRSRIVAKALKFGATLARRMGRPWWVQAVKESILPSLAYRRLGAEEKPTLSASDRSRLQDYFRPDVARLSQYIGRDLDGQWFGNR
jgi:hypothetical protein